MANSKNIAGNGLELFSIPSLTNLVNLKKAK